MAESKSKTSTVNGASKSTAKQPGIFDELFSCVKGVAAHTENFKSLNDVVAENIKLKKELKKHQDDLRDLEHEYGETRRQLQAEEDKFKDNIATLSMSLGDRIITLQKTADDRQSDLEACNREIEVLERQRDHEQGQAKELREDNSQLKKEARTAEAMRDRHERNAQLKESECSQLRSELSKCEVERDTYESELHELENEVGADDLITPTNAVNKNLRDELKALSASARGLAERYFDESNSDTYNPAAVNDLLAKFPTLPISTTRSNEGLLLRRGAVESLLVKVLINRVFRPFYIPSTLASDGHHDGDKEHPIDGHLTQERAAELLCRLFGHDERQMSIYRAHVLKALSQFDDARPEVAQGAADEVIHVLGKHVPRNWSAFQEELVQFFANAARIWSTHVQLRKDTIRVFPPEYGVQPVTERAEYGPRLVPEANTTTATTKSAESDARRDVQLVLFPLVYIQGQTKRILIPGEVVWTDQAVVVSAMAHVEDERKKKSMGTPTRSTTLRRSSNAGSMLSPTTRARAQ